MRKRILFLIHDLGGGGAEKVLVNLVNNMDRSRFDITVCALFGGGIREKDLLPDNHFYAVFDRTIPGNSQLMKLMSPEQLHKLCVKGTYDIEVSYLEGPCARIISGCTNKNTKLVAWIHVEQHTMGILASSFRNAKEAVECYAKYDQTVCVSQYVMDDFTGILHSSKPCRVLYNTVESEKIQECAGESVAELCGADTIRLISVGTLKQSKGHDRTIRIVKRLVDEGYTVHLYILGDGPQRQKLESLIEELKIQECVTLLGYSMNPYKYVANCDLLICASHAEGFSTAATEALIVGTPVCTVEVSGMKEMLGENNEYGVVTANDDEALYCGIKQLLDQPKLLQQYKKLAAERGKSFSTTETVVAVEEMLLNL